MQLKTSIKLFLLFLCLNGFDCVYVRTSSGLVRGTTVEVFGQKVNQFLGIPFAEAPVGDLRFAKPKPLKKPIKGVIDATEFKYSCIQDENHYQGLTISEDCLFLNVWSQSRNSPKNLKPVIVWIFGGMLTYGTIFLPKYNGSILATHDVVYAAINYRSNWFGFLYGNDSSAPGNVGLFDQALGLQWIQENIHLFGGDKNNVLIFGSSAGAQSVSTQVLSPVSRGLFRRAIIESGANVYRRDKPQMTKDKAYRMARDLAREFKCHGREWLKCLRGVEAKKFLAHVPSTMSPLSGTEFLPFSAQEAFDRQKFNSDVDIIAGISSDEGTVFIGDYPELDTKDRITEEDFYIFIDKVKATQSPLLDDINATEVVGFYLKNTDLSDSSAIRWRIFDFIGDVVFKCTTYVFAKRYAEQSPEEKHVFFYELTQSAKDPEYQERMGISHDALSQFVFGLIILENGTLPANIKLSREIMRLWTNFAKNGTADYKWPELLDSARKESATIVKELNAFKPNKYFYNHFKYTCDGFWKHLYK